MCLYPTYGQNPKYRPNKKNGGHVPPLSDERMKIVPFNCGKCFECRKRKRNDWRIRLTEELENEFGYFVTLTFSNDEFLKLEKQIGLDVFTNENTIATKAVRWFLERCRKETGKSIKHWFVTELGDDKDRLHLHGIIFGQKAMETVKRNWKYGGIYVGQFCNCKSINYITKYMLKVDLKHPTYTQIVLASKGLGETERVKKLIQWQKRHIKEIRQLTYTYKNGQKCALPKYYKDKYFTDDEKAIVWMNNLNNGKLWVGKVEMDADDIIDIEKMRQVWQGYYKSVDKQEPSNWDVQKAMRRYEKQRRKVAEARKKERNVLNGS